MRAEVRRDGVWMPAGEVFSSYDPAEPWEGRNYDLFAMLADVRNGRGFAGTLTGSGFMPISEPKGIPYDAHPETVKYLEAYEFDGHSHSFLNLAELNGYDWHGQTTLRYGVVDAETYEHCKTIKSTPDSWCASIGGMDIVTFSEMGYAKWLAAGRPDIHAKSTAAGLPDAENVIGRPINDVKGEKVKPFVRMIWEVTYCEAAGSHWFKAMDRLAELVPEDGTDEDVRIAFFFDN